MNFVIKNNQNLRTGITTGACAAAAAKAAATLLLSGRSTVDAMIETDHGAMLRVPVCKLNSGNDTASCGVIKDAGDDPDVTHGIEIVVTVSKSECGVTIDGGIGVGRVTKPGLSVLPGNAAINPVPRRMIHREVESVCRQFDYKGGLNIVVSVPNGEEISKKTMNRRLGIVGGISILGTTGIVEPMSEKAIVDAIKTEIDMRVAERCDVLLVTPGNYGREFACKTIGLDFEKAVMCSNYIGEILDYVHSLGIDKMILVGHAGKMIKLAGGVMNTHSSIADCRIEIFAAHAAISGVNPKLVRGIMECVTVDAAMELVCDNNVLQQIWNSIGMKIAFYLHHRTAGKPLVEFYVFSRERGMLVHDDTANVSGETYETKNFANVY